MACICFCVWVFITCSIRGKYFFVYFVCLCLDHLSILKVRNLILNHKTNQFLFIHIQIYIPKLSQTLRLHGLQHKRRGPVPADPWRYRRLSPHSLVSHRPSWRRPRQETSCCRRLPAPHRRGGPAAPLVRERPEPPQGPGRGSG